MALVDPWDHTSPDGADNPKQGDDEMRTIKRATTERHNQGGVHWTNSASVDQDDGKSMCGVQGTTGTLELAYEEDGDALITCRDDTAAADASQVDIGDGVGGSREYQLNVQDVNCDTVTAADTLTGKRTHTISVYLPAAAIGRVEGLVIENQSGAAWTLKGARAICFTKPNGGPVTIEMKIVDLSADATDPGAAAGTEVWVNPNEITIADDKYTSGAMNTSMTNASLPDGSAWVFEIDAINSADDITVILEVEVTV